MAIPRSCFALGTAVAIAALTATAGFGGDVSPSPGRPIVLLVHGRGLLGRDTSALRREWQDAIDRGAALAFGRPLLRDGDVRLVWYADALDPASEDSCESASTASPMHAGESGVADLLGTMGALLTWAVGGSRGDDAELRALAGDLLYVADPHRRCAAERRLAGALAQARAERRPIVLVAHSFGALVVYGYLSSPHREDTTPEARVEQLVTIGSLLGDAELRELLFGASARRQLELPPSVRGWINVRRADDPFAAPLSVDGASSRLRDVVVPSSSSGVEGAHDVVGYLAHPTTARAVLGAWCAAFEPGATDRPVECAAASDVR